MSANNPYVCVCHYYSCNLVEHESEGVGTVPGRILSRQVYQQHQQKEAQTCAKKGKEPLELPAGGAGPPEVSNCVSNLIISAVVRANLDHFRQFQRNLEQKATLIIPL